MNKYVVSAYASLRADVLVEAETASDALDIVSSVFEENGESLFKIERDYLEGMNDYEVQTLQDSISLDGIGEEDCITL